MSLKSRKARRLATAGLTASVMLGMAASSAQAIQTATLTYRCKYPLIGTNPLSIKIELDIPDTWPAGKPTDPFGIKATASAGGNTVPGLSLVEGLAAIEGVSSARSIVQVPGGGPPVIVNVPITIPKYVLPTPVPDPLVLIATGSTPSLTIDEVGDATIILDKLALNLKATDAAGDAIILPPVTKDIDLLPVKDSDGLPETFDVYCKVDAGQNMTLGKFTLVDDTPPPPPNTAPTKPGTPTLNAATTTETSLAFSWAASTDDGAVTGYDVYNGATKVKTVTGTSTTIDGLSPNTAYNIKVVANDNGATVLSTSSDVASLKTKAVTPPPNTAPTKPGAPTLGAATTETSLAFSWAASTDDGAVTGYDVYNGATKVATVTGTSATINGLTADTAYSIKVVALDNGTPVLSTSSDVVSLKTKAPTPPPLDTIAPSAPGEGILTEADFTPTSINLKWTASTDNVGGTGVKEYVIRYEDVVIKVPAGTLTKKLEGLGADSEYFIEITAVDNAGNVSDILDLFYVTPGIDPGPNTAPTKPGTPVLGAATTTTSLAFSWAASTDNGAVTGYDVYNGATKVATVTGTSATINGLTADTAYSIKVVALDNGTPVLSTSSDVVSLKTKAVTPPPNTAPTKPGTPSGTSTETTVSLSWTASTDDKAVTGYNVYNGATKVATVTGAAATITGLTADTAYTFKVEALDAEGLKTSSDAFTIKTKVQTPPVGNAPIVKSIIGKIAFAKVGGISLVQGTNFTGVKSVTVGGKPATVSTLGNNLLLVILPPLAKGTYPLVVTTAGGTSATTTSTTVKYISLF